MAIFSRKHPKQKTEVTISNRTVIRVLLLIVVALMGITAVQQASHALLLIFTAFFLALALNAPVHWISQHLPGKRKGNRNIGTAISFLIVILLLAGFLASLVPPLVRQTDKFITSVPTLARQAKDKDTEIGKLVEKYNLQAKIDDFSDDLGSRLQDASGVAVSTIGKISSSVFTVLTVLVLTIMMLTEGPRWIRLFKEMIPDDERPHVERLATEMYKVVKGYVNGQVVLAALASIFIFPVMVFLKIDYPVALMGIVFICGLIPMVGHTIGAVIVSLVALFTSPLAALILLAYYFLYQQIENYLVQPRIQANSTNMSPLLVFASVIIGVNFAGLLGGLVAIPIAGCIRIIVLDYLRRKNIIQRPDLDHDVLAPTEAANKA